MSLHVRSPDNTGEATMMEEITVTAQLVYQCNAEFSLERQADQIYGDMHRLLAPYPASRVECCAVAVKYAASEAETYGSEENRALAERQAARLGAALGGLAYPDDEDDPHTLLRNALTDLRHFADQNGLPFAATDQEAHAIYTQEKRS